MYAVLCNPLFWNEINNVISQKGEEILVKDIGNEIDLIDSFEKIGRISIKHLIIDISAIQDTKKLLSCIKRYRIKNDKTQIIIIAPNVVPPDQLMYSLVTMGIYDIINPKAEKLEDILLASYILEVLENPSTYKKAVRWFSDEKLMIEDDVSSGVEGSGVKEKIIQKESIVELEVERVVEVETIDNGVITLFSFFGKGQSLISNIIAENFAFRGYKTTLINLDAYSSANYYYDIDINFENNIQILIENKEFSRIYDEAYSPMKNLKVITGKKNEKVEINHSTFNNILNSARGRSDIVIVDIDNKNEIILNSSIVQSTVNIALINTNHFYNEMSILKIKNLIDKDILSIQKTIAIINEIDDKQDISYKKAKLNLDKIVGKFKRVINFKYVPTLNDFILSGENFYSNNMDDNFKEDVNNLMDALKSKKLSPSHLVNKKLNDIKRTIQIMLENKMLVILLILLLITLFALFLGSPIEILKNIILGN